MPSTIIPRPGGLRPWAFNRYRSRYSLAETLRREYLGQVADYLPDDDVMFLVPPAVRKDMLADRDGRG